MTVEDKANDNGGISLISAFELAINDDEFLITAPMYNRGLYPLQKDEEVAVQYVTNRAFFETNARVVARLRKGDLHFLRMKITSDVRRNQRRNDFRVDVLLETVIYLADDTDPSRLPDDAEPVKALIANLSAGGAAIYCTLETEVGKFLQVVMPDEVLGQRRSLTAQIHWIREADPHLPYKQYMGARFLFDDSGDKEKLVKYTFETQRKKLKKN